MSGDKLNVRKLLEGDVSGDELEHIPRAFEIIGDIAMVELDEVARKHGELIAKAIMQLNRNVKVVLNKTGDVAGRFRVPEFAVILAKPEERDFPTIKKEFRPKKITETVHTEHGCRFLLDVSKVYFSSRLGFERKRIAEIVKDGERVLVMFAGVGPFAIVIGKNAKPREVIGVELNPHAVEYFRKNVVLNKVEGRVRVIEGDVAEVVPRLEGKFDRIVMPAPKNAPDYLELALEKVKKGGMIHLYTFAGEEEIESGDVIRKVEERCRNAGKDARVVFFRKCGAVAPYHYRVVVDLKVR